MTQAYGQGRHGVVRVRLDSRAVGVSLSNDQTPNPLASPRRSHALMEAIRRRFPGFPHSEAFHAWNVEQARDDPDRFLTTRLFSDINRGHTPTPRHVSALAAATGWT